MPADVEEGVSRAAIVGKLLFTSFAKPIPHSILEEAMILVECRKNRKELDERVGGSYSRVAGPILLQMTLSLYFRGSRLMESSPPYSGSCGKANCPMGSFSRCAAAFSRHTRGDLASAGVSSHSGLTCG